MDVESIGILLVINQIYQMIGQPDLILRVFVMRFTVFMALCSQSPAEQHQEKEEERFTGHVKFRHQSSITEDKVSDRLLFDFSGTICHLLIREYPKTSTGS